MNYSNFMKVSMHKMFSIVVLAALVLSLVPLNQAQAAGVGNPDLECTNKGFDFGIAKWEWDDVDGAWEVEVDSPFPLAGYSTDVSGAPDAVAWTASPAVAGVLSKEGTETFVKTGGESGSFGQGSKAISHVTFCGNNPDKGTLTVQKLFSENGNPAGADKNDFGFAVNHLSTTTFDFTTGEGKVDIVVGENYSVTEVGIKQDLSGWKVEYGPDCSGAMSTDGKICTITNTQVLGCMDPKAENYNSSATLDDGSCDYPPAPACTVTVVSDATNYVVETDANAVDLLANGFTKPGAWVSGIVDSLAKWIWSDASAGTAAPVANDVKTFEKTFVWNGPVSDAEIVIGSDNQHTVFFNGTEVGSTAALTTFSAPVTYTIPSNLVVSGNNTVSIAVTNAGAVASGNPAGLMYDLTVSGNDKVDCTVVPLPTFTIEGYKYNDLNGDGVKDDGENGIEDWEFELLYKGEVVATTSTDVDGKYQFLIEYEEGKFPWEYQVVEVGQTNWTLTALFQLMGENTELVEICQYPEPELFVVAQDVPMVRPGVLPPSITMGCNFLNTYTEPEEEIEEEEPRRRSSSGTRVRPELPPQASSVAGEATSRPEGSVLGEQVSAVPLGAAATGAGGTAPAAPSAALIYGIVAPLARRD